MQFLDMVTIVTIGGILAILLLYIAVVYKKGWLKRNGVETHFLCPNPKCRKSFAQPVLLTDLSKTPPESHPACPHCGLDLNTIPYFKEQKNFDFRNTQGAPLFKKPIERSQLSKRDAVTPNPGAANGRPKPSSPLRFQSEKKPSHKEARDCPHFFGYVRNLPKNTPIPDDCLGCPWIVECLTAEAEKAEA